MVFEHFSLIDYQNEYRGENLFGKETSCYNDFCFRERELQLQNPCMATLTAGGMMGDDPLGNGSSFIRPIGHRIYVPMETSFAHATRVQAEREDDDKRQIPPPPPKYTS